MCVGSGSAQVCTTSESKINQTHTTVALVAPFKFQVITIYTCDKDSWGSKQLGVDPFYTSSKGDTTQVWLDGKSLCFNISRGVVQAIIPTRLVWYMWYYLLSLHGMRSMSPYRRPCFNFFFFKNKNKNKGDSMAWYLRFKLM